MAVRNAIVNAPRPPEKFAEIKERVNIEVSDDGLQAFITLFVNEEDLSGPHRADLFKEMMRGMKDKGITYGVKSNVLLNKMVNHQKILVAEGVAPVNGQDSTIRMYEMKEAKPEAKEDGNVDHYELNLINRVIAGDWLGERIEATDGIPGKTVKGSTLLPVRGKELPLFYDRNTVRELYEDGKTVLYAKINGAVHYDGDKISVSNHLEIVGNINFKTGNIDFDGFLTIKGTVEDHFSVTATKDIEIIGDYGVGAAKEIISKSGSIYMKGGIAGNGKTVIRSGKNIYTKFVADTSIICDGSVHIGFYCLNSSIRAKEVILDSPRGQIIGGNIEAEIRVVASTIGSSSEKRTSIVVTGFNRKLLKSYLDEATTDIEQLKGEMAKAKFEMAAYSNTQDLSREQRAVYEKIMDHFFKIRDLLKRREDERKSISSYLKTHGEGEIAVLKKVYPNTQLEIKKIIKEITSPVMSTSFFVQDGEMKEL